MADEKREERGPKSPAETLETAVGLVRQVRENVGFGNASRETLANALGYPTLHGRSNRVIASLVHFGLLERTGPAIYRISELGKRLLMPRDDGEYKEALAEAVQRPGLYQKLFTRFGGEAVPTMLPNILAREFGVWPGSSEDVASIFRASAEYAELLRNGVLHTSRADIVSAPDEAPTEGRSPAVSIIGSAGLHSFLDGVSDSRRYTIPLGTDGRQAVVELPIPVSQRDLRWITRWAEYMGELATDSDDDAPTESMAR